jgi:hypothetical protein
MNVVKDHICVVGEMWPYLLPISNRRVFIMMPIDEHETKRPLRKCAFKSLIEPTSNDADPV